MINTLTLAALCSAGAIWLLLSPASATHRLDRLLPQRQHKRRPPQRIVHLLRVRFDAVRKRRKLPARWRSAVIELCDGMAAELAAGRTPEEAFDAATAVLDPDIAESLNAATSQPQQPLPHPSDDFAIDLPEHLESLAVRPGAEGLRLLAACWRIGAERGGTLATVLDGLASALRDQEAQRQEVAIQLAGPRATSRLLAALPLLGLGMAVAIGAEPLAFLCGTFAGLVCLLTGVSLNFAGLWWTRRLAQAAETP